MKQTMMRPVKAAILILAALFFATACGRPAAPATPNPDAALLAAHWEKFIPIESMPDAIILDSSGGAVAGGVNGRWRLEGGMLYIRYSGEEDAFSYTVSGYMLTVYNTKTDTSGIFINAEAFAAGADKNADFQGQWAAWSTFGKMAFDGGTDLNDIIYTTAGRTVIGKKYAARDGILQTADTSGNYTYNLYSFSPDGALQLAETADYDNDEKQWTQYWKKAEAKSGLTGIWKQVISANPGGTGLPAVLTLANGGAGTATVPAGAPAAINWEYYPGDFIIIEYSQTNLVYAWETLAGGTLYLGNPDVDEAWYIDTSRYKPTTAPLDSLIGVWEAEEGSMRLTFKANHTVEMRNEAGETSVVSALAQDGLMQLSAGGKTYYMAYTVDEDTIKLNYNELPFLEQKEMPVTLVRKK